jgi:hypothetical protein
MTVWYEVAIRDQVNAFPEIDAFEDIEEAIVFADENGADIIYECGGSYDTFGKCWFCEQWVPLYELDRENTCHRCQLALMSRGEY